MENSYSFVMNNDINWETIVEIRNQTQKFLKARNIDEESTTDILMCVTELSENAIKHGEINDDGYGIHFNLEHTGGNIKVEVKNQVMDPEKLNNFLDHMNKIQNAEDISQLYLNRLTELLQSENPGVSELGLYRIAYEGNFTINYAYEDKDRIISIICNRKVK